MRPPSIAQRSRASATPRCIAGPSVRSPACLIRSTDASVQVPRAAVPLDRDAALQTADKLLRQGKLADAIAEYVRLVEQQPSDWNSINALGDLYVRAGDGERAAARFAI